MYYIQRKDQNYLETVDEFQTKKEALYCLNEYRMADTYGHYYLSQRPCKEWKEATKEAETLTKV